MLMVPKYDGSLFNLTYISNKYPIYPMLKELIDSNIGKLPPKSYYEMPNGIFMIGSKGTVFSKNPVNERIHNSICGSYNSVEEFLNIASEYLNSELFDLSKQIVNLHFEAIDTIPTPELTVYYGKAWCPFFGITIYDINTNTKTFKLPLDEYVNKDICRFKSVAEIFDCQNDWSNINKLYEDNYQKLLDGDQIIEPEGYVLHIFGSNGDWIPIKYKYKIYYTAHKPESKHNLTMALELTSNPKYKLICQRLAKFRAKPSIADLLDSSVDDIDKIREQIILAISNLTKPANISKRDWALYWKDSSNINKLMEYFDNIKAKVSEHYDQYNIIDLTKTVFGLIMKLFDTNGLNDPTNHNLTYETIYQMIKNMFV
jgi:hypothetical protein